MAGSQFALLAALMALAALARADLVAPHEDGGELGARICASADADNWHFAHPRECNRFIKCDVANGRSSIITCPVDQLWNDAATVCDWADNVECRAGPTTTSRRPRPPPPTTTTTRRPRPPPPTTTTTRRPPPPPPTTTTRRPRPPPTTTAAPIPGDWDSLCRPYNPHRYHVPHPSDNTKFYKCDWTVRVAYEFDCPAGLVFNARIQVCDWP